MLLSLPSSVALMNHSCSPNVIVTYKGTVAEVRAVQEINPGDEVRKAGIVLQKYPKRNYRNTDLFILIDVKWPFKSKQILSI